MQQEDIYKTFSSHPCWRENAILKNLLRNVKPVDEDFIFPPYVSIA